jgi:hypothetical protein
MIALPGSSKSRTTPASTIIPSTNVAGIRSNHIAGIIREKCTAPGKERHSGKQQKISDSKIAHRNREIKKLDACGLKLIERRKAQGGRE